VSVIHGIKQTSGITGGEAADSKKFVSLSRLRVSKGRSPLVAPRRERNFSIGDFSFCCVHTFYLLTLKERYVRKG
ncbi:MAG: hypothetical protein K2N60_12360, partial [Oscillospiraceae bacterium]|nr:hypothetical protein [Oscillospiraceae bacterium]